jgi:hypothetical protein
VMRDSLNLLMVQRLKQLKGALSVEEAREHASAVAKRSGGGSGSGVQPRTGSARKSSR